ESLAALTANSQREGRLSASAPCDPSPAPVPAPPVAYVPAACSEPSAARSKTATALPLGWFVSVYTLAAPALAAKAREAAAVRAARAVRCIVSPVVRGGGSSVWE